MFGISLSDIKVTFTPGVAVRSTTVPAELGDSSAFIED